MLLSVGRTRLAMLLLVVGTATGILICSQQGWPLVGYGLVILLVGAAFGLTARDTVGKDPRFFGTVPPVVRAAYVLSTGVCGILLAERALSGQQPAALLFTGLIIALGVVAFYRVHIADRHQ